MRGLARSLADRGGLASVRHRGAHPEVRSGRGGGDWFDSPGVSAGSHCPRGRMCGSNPPSATAFSRARLGCCGMWRTGGLLCVGRGDMDSPIRTVGWGPRQRSLRYRAGQGRRKSEMLTGRGGRKKVTRVARPAPAINRDPVRAVGVIRTSAQRWDRERLPVQRGRHPKSRRRASRTPGRRWAARRECE